MKDKINSFIWQHFLLLISLYVMTLGVAVCVRSQLGSSVISTIPYVMESAARLWTQYRSGQSVPTPY